MDESDLDKLSAIVDDLLAGGGLAATIAALESELAGSAETFVWRALDLTGLAARLPASIESGWIFHLRRDVPSGAHYHPNSVQHMVMVAGQGRSRIDGVEAAMVSYHSASADRWLVIDAGIPHEFVPAGGNMTVISFHTCAANELEEVDCQTGSARRYE